MTSQDFTIWMRGFVAACHEYQPTPKQWDDLKDQLKKVEDYGESQEELENDFFGAWKEDPGTFQVHPQPPYPGPNLRPNGTDNDLVQRYPWGGQVVWAGTPIPTVWAGTSIPTSGSTSTSISSVWVDNPNNITYTVTTASGYPGVGTYLYPNGTTVTYTAGTTGTNEFHIPKEKELLLDQKAPKKKKKKNVEEDYDLGGSE